MQNNFTWSEDMDFTLKQRMFFFLDKKEPTPQAGRQKIKTDKKNLEILRLVALKFLNSSRHSRDSDKRILTVPLAGICYDFSWTVVEIKPDTNDNLSLMTF